MKPCQALLLLTVFALPPALLQAEETDPETEEPADESPEPTKTKKAIEDLKEEEALWDQKAKTNVAKNKALFGAPKEVKPLDGSLEIKKGEAAISEWATMFAVKKAATDIQITTKPGVCPKVTPVAWSDVSKARARLARIQAMSKKGGDAIIRKMGTENFSMRSLTGWGPTITAATDWLVQMAGYFRSDLSTEWATTTVTPDTASTALAGTILAGSVTRTISVPYPTDADFTTAEGLIKPMLDEVDKIIAAGKGSESQDKLDDAIALAAKKDQLVDDIAQDVAAARLSTAGYCMLEVTASNSIAATTTSKNLFRTPRSYDRGSVTLKWELVTPAGEMVGAGLVTAICEADTKLTRKVNDITPKCKVL